MTARGRREVSSVAAVYVLQLAEFMQARGMPMEPLLAEHSLSCGALREPRARVPLATYLSLTEHVRKVTGEPALGVLLGARARVTAHGLLGFGLLAARARTGTRTGSRLPI